MKLITSFLLYILTTSVCFSQATVHSTSEFNDAQIEKEITYTYKLGHKKVKVFVSTYGSNKNIVMINLHDNERTSVEAARIVLKETGGTLIRIENNNQRLINFNLCKNNYQFDPNRIFTKPGTTASLNRYSKANSRSIRKVSKFGKFIYSKIPDSNLLIALHNNSDSNYSTLSYLPGGEEEKEAALVNYNQEHDIDDFFFTTSKFLFEKLKSAKQNVILQNNSNATDDGSLSVLYGLKNKEYVNIEAEHGHLKEQEKMIRSLLNFIWAK